MFQVERHGNTITSSQLPRAIATCNFHVQLPRDEEKIFSRKRCRCDGENGNCRGRLKGVECRGAQVQRHSGLKVQRHNDTKRNVKYGY
jgi:hypothetical protein